MQLLYSIFTVTDVRRQRLRVHEYGGNHSSVPEPCNEHSVYMASTLFVWVLMAWGTVGAESAGMATHTEVGERAAKYFGKILRSPNADKYNQAIRNHPDAVIAGSDFPDFLCESQRSPFVLQSERRT